MSGNRLDLATLAGPAQPAKVPAFVKASPARSMRVADIAPNPLNTRHVSDTDAEEMAESLTIHGQLSACVVVTRAAFLRIFPEHEGRIGGHGHVQVVGARRLAGAVKAQRPNLEVQVKDELAADRLTFLAATAAENLDRKDLNPIEEARAISIMVEEDGITRKEVAGKLGRTAAWVTQRMHLQNLLPELQTLVIDGGLPILAARQIGSKKKTDQLAAYERWQTEKDTPPEPAPEPAPGPGGEGDPQNPDSPPESEDEPRNPESPPERVKPDKFATAVRHLGTTGPAIARTLEQVLPDSELQLLYETLRERFAP